MNCMSNGEYEADEQEESYNKTNDDHFGMFSLDTLEDEEPEGPTAKITMFDNENYAKKDKVKSNNSSVAFK